MSTSISLNSFIIITNIFQIEINHVTHFFCCIQFLSSLISVLFYGNENSIFGFEFLLFIFILFTTGSFLIAILSIGIVFKVIWFLYAITCWESYKLTTNYAAFFAPKWSHLCTYLYYTSFFAVPTVGNQSFDEK